MHEDLILLSCSADPLRHLDPRFEPPDPLFDCEEPLIPKPKKKPVAALAAITAAAFACGGSRPAPLHATAASIPELPQQRALPDSSPT